MLDSLGMELGYYYVGFCRVGMRCNLAESESERTEQHRPRDVFVRAPTRLASFATNRQSFASTLLYSFIPHPCRHGIDTFPWMLRPPLLPSPTTGHTWMTQLVGRRRKHTSPLASGLLARVAHSERAKFGSPSPFMKDLPLYRFIQDFSYVFLPPFALNRPLSLQCLLP
jgi:hypothetical protein